MSPEAAKAVGSFHLAFWWQTLLWSWALCAVVGAAIGELKGRRWAGLALGVFLGPAGVVAACLLWRNPANDARHYLKAAGLLLPKPNGGQGAATPQSGRNRRNGRRRVVCPRCSADLYPSATARTIRCEICRSELSLPTTSH